MHAVLTRLSFLAASRDSQVFLQSFLVSHSSNFCTLCVESMNFYFDAAVTLDRLGSKQGSIKGVIASLPEKNRKRTAALVIETLKYKPVLLDVIETSKLMKEERKLTSLNLALVLVHDLLLAGGIQAGNGPLKQAVLRHKTRLHGEFQKLKIKRGATSVADLAQTGDVRAEKIPRYVRVNTILWSLEQALEYLQSRGFILSTSLDSDKAFMKDKHISNLLLFPAAVTFHDDPAYKAGKLILQDKASCFPAAILSPPAHNQAVVLDATSAPGNKTTHLSALMRGKGKVTPCHVVQDNPSCSGSGIINRLDHLLESEEENAEIQEDRLNKLASFQLMMIRHAMKFPSVRRIVYSTCSIHVIENEHVVRAALLSEEAQASSFCLAPPTDILPGWPRRGIAEEMTRPEDALSLIRCSPGEDETNGFFVSCFVRNDGTLKRSFPELEEDIGYETIMGPTKRKKKKKKSTQANDYVLSQSHISELMVDTTAHPARKIRSAARPSTAPEKLRQALLPAAMHTLQEDEVPESIGSHSDAASPASEFVPAHRLPVDLPNYDWATFITAYACGRWDPHRIPRPPHVPLSLSKPESPSHTGSAVPQGALAFDHTRLVPRPPSHRLRASFSAVSSSAPSPPSFSSTYPSFTLPATLPFTTITTSAGSVSSPISTVDAQTTAATLRWAGSRVNVAPLALPSPEHELMDPMRGAAAVPVPGSHPEIPVSFAHAQQTVSPHPVPGFFSQFHGAQTPGWDVMTPGGTRRSRLSGFWSGTIDVDNSDYDSPEMLPTLEDLADRKDQENETQLTSGPQNGHSVIPDDLPTFHPGPATAPLHVSRDLTEDDNYFGLPTNDRVSTSSPDRQRPSAGFEVELNSGAAPSSLKSVDQSIVSSGSTPTLVNSVPYSVLTESFTQATAQSVPAPGTRRRSQLTRQSSAPLPTTSVSIPVLTRTLSGDSLTRPPIGTISESAPAIPTASLVEQSPVPTHTSSKEDARAVREELAFLARGFLAPPFPPDELGRRRALYKFNIIDTTPDLNFDRIAHLAMLVFNTKGVVISVVDGEKEWCKSEWGMTKIHTCARSASFAAHAILQRGDEPMIVLDTKADWRFADSASPLVVGGPSLRFYAGAPLRTHDGFNIGCLSLIDDSPHECFTPRQRHTLKEFAAIAMREMELWRDKIQLRIRDRIQTSMEQFSRECLEIDNEVSGQSNKTKPPSDESRSPPPVMGTMTSMDTVYDRAAHLVQQTLDVEGVVVADVSHCEVLESMSSEATVSIVLHHGEPGVPTSTHTLSGEEHIRLNEFFARYPNGKISEGIVPPSLRFLMPSPHIQYALAVPIYNIDKRPFALLCAWNASNQARRFLEGHELSFLRAIGVIVVSAVLKRRMILADKAKGLFISNISHELRTPLHGILAAAELLSDSPLNHSQTSFLQTVQACGTSLVETVNHVLDFTKLSGNSKSGGVENVIVPSKVDLMQLVEEAVDGCWIGHRARTAIMSDSEIGSVYSPPEQLLATKQLVETVVDIGWRRGGWTLKCERGGIRRVLMNIFGNSLKFTSNGYVHIMLRELAPSPAQSANEVKVELVVFDTGKGISEGFRKNQLFHPFSQENPLQTGTGLGLAIVNSIVKSESVNGKVDVWSEEGVGTEIKVTFTAQIPEEASAPEMEPFRFDTKPLSVSMLGFDTEHKGVLLVRSVIETYLTSWWGFDLQPPGPQRGDIIILNENIELLRKATAERDTSRPFIILSTLHGNRGVLAEVAEHESIGGFCRVLYKPGGPSRLYALLKLCVHTIKIASSTDAPSGDDHDPTTPTFTVHVPRRNSEETANSSVMGTVRPAMMARAMTIHPASSLSWKKLSTTVESNDEDNQEVDGEDPGVPTINIGAGSLLLRSSLDSVIADRRFRILVVEDNTILRQLLIKWLTTRGYDYRDAVDGRKAVSIYEEDGPFDVVLLDMSMPVLDGIGATTEIRRFEAGLSSAKRRHPTRILALTGMSSLEDKRRAFKAGVDGYMIKPVAFKTLDEMFSKLGVS
ncbi:unnamed protein product [Mycena citricolor]|uniref:histidine kinase n=1 Tax=Mycena citricolor TaxID=2018698 RepID=A0AAD2JYN5_9AGAR|nr:unnamed protein product [Mycena citricolor]